jgi:hypothetical protein
VSIKFFCSCGQSLRARDEMASRRCRCPRCGNPVGVPSLRPTHAGTQAAPMTPEERYRLRRGRSVGWAESSRPTSGDRVGLEDSAHPTTTDLPPPKPPRRTPKLRQRRQLEQHWYQCLAYPFLNWKLLLFLAFLLSVTMVGVLLTFQEFPAFSVMSLQGWFPWVCSILLVTLIVAYAYATVECALISALAGAGPALYWAGLPFKSGLRWLVCFLAGPIVPVGCAVYFWIYGGDLDPLDWIILAELGVFAAAFWLLAIVCTNERNRLRDANPLRVMRLVHRLKARAVVPVLIAPALGIVHVWLGLSALLNLHGHIFTSWLLLMLCWWSGLSWATFLLRLLGVWCYRASSAHG